jgi:hypothetical protein
LQKTEDGCKAKYNDGNPKSVPLGFVPPVVPKITDTSMMRLFKHLFQDQKSVAPVHEFHGVPLTVQYFVPMK